MEEIGLFKVAVNSTYALLSKFNSNQEKAQILEPFTCAVRIATLHFKENGTKLSISNNRIYYQDPNPLQGVIRWSYNDNRNDLHQICNPLKKFVEWYKPNENPQVKKILKYTILGLNSLKQTYLDSNHIPSHLVIHSISHYMDILAQSLTEEEKVNLLPSLAETVVQDSCDMYTADLEASVLIEDAPLLKSHQDIYKEIKNMWTDRDVKIVYDLLTVAHEHKKRKECYNDYIKSLDCLLDGKDRNLSKLIVRFTSSL